MIPKCKDSFDEQKIVDFVLGNLAEEEKRSIEDHLLHCSHCSALYDEWKGILAHDRQYPQPSPILKERILMSAQEQRNWKRHLSKPKVTLGVLGTAAVLLLAVVFYQSGIPMNTDDNEHHYVLSQDEHIYEHTSVVQDPRSVEYHLTPAAIPNIEGNVWVNDATQEMLLKVEGLQPLIHNDYQVWLVQARDYLNGGLLQEQNGEAILYFKGSPTAQLESIRVSMEPSGGSTVPTGPYTFFVVLKKE